MCGGAKVLNGKIDIYLGYYGSSVCFKDLIYRPSKPETTCTRDEMHDALKKLTKEQLIEAFLEMAELGDEE